MATAIVVTSWKNWASFYQVELSTVMQRLRPATIEVYENLKKAGIENEAIAQILERELTQQSFLLSYNDIHWMAGWLLLLLIPFIWGCQGPLRVREPHSLAIRIFLPQFSVLGYILRS